MYQPFWKPQSDSEGHIIAQGSRRSSGKRGKDEKVSVREKLVLLLTTKKPHRRNDEADLGYACTVTLADGDSGRVKG